MYNRRSVGGRSSTSGFFRQAVPAISLSLERSTARVPKDGYFYVLLQDEIKGRFRTKNEALALYRTLREDSGYTPPAAEPSGNTLNEVVQRYLDELEAYWSESHRHTRRGGKSMYRS